MKNIVLWINGQGNQVALANKVNEAYRVKAIVVEKRKSTEKMTASKLYEKIYQRIFLREVGESWNSMQAAYKNKYPSLPDCDILEVENINSEECLEFTRSHKPDIIVVSGTRLVKKHMFDIKASIGVVNLHTGLSPYVKGGPNCTNWCIANNEPHLIGNTTMWIDEGIDTGSIIATDYVDFTGNETLSEVHVKVMDHAHDLYVRSILRAIENKETCPSIPQKELGVGKTYYTKMWGLPQKINLIKNFKNFSRQVNSPEFEKKRSQYKILPLN
ncbi:hypothetical protein LRS06_07040 [Hymenobacter sp. J193]|uniref:formyltransferase family protein n=1 Tax=Hymenobacter sp. J193 TaxID=2898429 RepID=UPI002150B1DE|nr:formyltransferase family protein [Hymenobacter sp. J193]MCR5887535.1 hypothetical protein [Hymenobacter sp. J193]